MVDARLWGAWALPYGLCDIIQPGCSGALFPPCQDPMLYYSTHSDYQKGQKCFLNVEITTLSYVQMNSIRYKMPKVVQLMANSERNSKNPASQFRIF